MRDLLSAFSIRIIKCASQTSQEIQSEIKPIYNYYGLKDENYLFY